MIKKTRGTLVQISNAVAEAQAAIDVFAPGKVLVVGNGSIRGSAVMGALAEPPPPPQDDMKSNTPIRVTYFIVWLLWKSILSITIASFSIKSKVLMEYHSV